MSLNQLNYPLATKTLMIIQKFHRQSRHSRKFTKCRCPLPHSQEPTPPHSVVFRNIVSFCDENLLAPRPNTKDHHLISVRDCTFNIFAATLHVCRPFHHRQRQDGPCRCDKDRHTAETVNQKNTVIVP